METDESQNTFAACVIHLDDHTDVVLTGELDVAAVPFLDNVLREVLASGERDLRLNASALTFLDARGIGCLLEARLKTLAAGGRFTVSSLSGSPLRVVTLCNLVATLTGAASPNEVGANSG
jgi:anti-anti-sigma factor